MPSVSTVVRRLEEEEDDDEDDEVLDDEVVAGLVDEVGVDVPAVGLVVAAPFRNLLSRYEAAAAVGLFAAAAAAATACLIWC